MRKLFTLLMLVVTILAGCASNEHLLFFTNSSLGVDISVEQGQTPVKFIVGYKRQEGVLDPIGQGYGFQKADTEQSLPLFDSKEIITTKEGYFYPLGVRSEPHSVIAKMNFGATGGGGTDTSAAQWFATGKAAEELAKNPATPAAIAGDARIVPTTEMSITKGKELRQITILKLAYKQLDDYVNSNGKDDKEAISIKKIVDDIDSGEFKKEFIEYKVVDNKLVATTFPEKSKIDGKVKSFSNVTDYLMVLEASIQNAVKLNSKGNLKVDEEEYSQVIENILHYKERLTQMHSELAKNQDVIKMLNIALFK